MTIITTINPKVGFIVSFLALAAFLGEINHGNPGIISFVLGYAFTLPLVMMIWRAMRKHWPIYKKFYSMSFHNRDTKTVIRSWKVTWWVLPYTLIVYSILEIIILQNPSLGSLYSFLYGALFAIFAYTALQSPKYYNQVKKKK